MGWFWKNDDDSGKSSSGDVGEFWSSNDDGGRCATRKVVKSQCHTEEVEPGKFVRKCEKTEQVFKDCVGRPTEMVQSNKEYTEEDVTDQMVQGSFSFKPAQNEPPPGLRSDVKNIELFHFSRVDELFDLAKALKNEFFSSVGVPDMYDNKVPSSYKKPGIHVEGGHPAEALKNEFFSSVGVPDMYDNEVPSSYKKPGIHVEGGRPAEALKKEFYSSVWVPHMYDNKVPSSYKNPGIHVEGGRPEEDFVQINPDGEIDLSGLSKDD